MKAWGPEGCIAHDEADLHRIFKRLHGNEFRSLGKVIVRKLVPLCPIGKTGEGFPMGREFRVFLYRNKILVQGFYWERDHPAKYLSESEASEVKRLAIDASTCINVPYIAVDIAQLANGSWIVLEAGDAQFSGLSQAPILELWQNLKRQASVINI